MRHPSDLLVAALAALFTVALGAQHEAPDTFGHSRHGDAFDDGPRQSAYLMAGMSDQVRFSVAGLSDEAQQFFDQGITQQHGFWYFEAERSFRQVAKLHPECAMAYWGMAMANVENAERAAGFIANAVEREQAATARERMWIDAWASYYQVDDKARTELQCGDAERVTKAEQELVASNKERKKELKTKLDKQLLKDLGTIVYEYPDDIEAKAFLAVQNWLANSWGSGVPITSHTAVDALLDQVFLSAPMHPAHHYRIHLWDREDARRALDSAAKNGSSAPGIAHEWHMSGHIYAKLNRHREAAWQQEASSRVDHAHMMRDSVMPFLIHNYGHNQEWLARSLSHVGRVEQALEIAKNLAELPRHPKYNRVDGGGDIANYGRQRLAQICEDHELWQDAVDLVEAGYLEQSRDVKSEVQRLGLLGRALFRLGRLDEASRVEADVGALLARARSERAAAIDTVEQKAFVDKVGKKEMGEAVATATRQSTDDVQAVLDLQRELAGERLLATGDAVAAIVEFEAVSGLPKTMLADAHLAAGQADKAVELLAKENERNPNRSATAARLVLAYRALSKPEHGDELAALEASLAGDQFDFGDSPLVQRLGLPRSAMARTADERALAIDAAATGKGMVGFGADFGSRPPLDTLGPRCWSPVANPGFDLPAIDGGRTSLGATGDGRARLVVFYLGFGCLHCVEQLHALRPLAKEFAALGVDVVAIGSDSVAAIETAHQDLSAEQRMPFPMLADPQLQAFQAWRCFDDFENMPLHGTFLVDGEGRIRWQDISYEPFMKIDWLVVEVRRLLALPAHAAAR